MADTELRITEKSRLERTFTVHRDLQLRLTRALSPEKDFTAPGIHNFDLELSNMGWKEWIDKRPARYVLKSNHTIGERKIILEMSFGF